MNKPKYKWEILLSRNGDRLIRVLMKDGLPAAAIIPEVSGRCYNAMLYDGRSYGRLKDARRYVDAVMDAQDQEQA